MASHAWAFEELSRIARRLNQVRRVLQDGARVVESTRPRARILGALRARGPSSVVDLAGELKLSTAVTKTTLLRLRPSVEPARIGVGRGHRTTWRIVE